MSAAVTAPTAPAEAETTSEPRRTSTSASPARGPRRLQGPTERELNEVSSYLEGLRRLRHPGPEAWFPPAG